MSSIRAMVSTATKHGAQSMRRRIRVNLISGRRIGMAGSSTGVKAFRTARWRTRCTASRVGSWPTAHCTIIIWFLVGRRLAARSEGRTLQPRTTMTVREHSPRSTVQGRGQDRAILGRLLPASVAAAVLSGSVPWPSFPVPDPEPMGRCHSALSRADAELFSVLCLPTMSTAQCCGCSLNHGLSLACAFHARASSGHQRIR
jgi:hypothetical protein